MPPTFAASRSDVPFLTRHAAARAQQRAIAPVVVDLLLDYATPVRARGADLYALDKEGRRRMRAQLGDATIGRLGRALDCYAVVSDVGSVITLARRCGRIRRKRSRRWF